MWGGEGRGEDSHTAANKRCTLTRLDAMAAADEARRLHLYPGAPPRSITGPGSRAGIPELNLLAALCLSLKQAH
eukprot:759786-Hanusia_phi.AAC.3